MQVRAYLLLFRLTQDVLEEAFAAGSADATS